MPGRWLRQARKRLTGWLRACGMCQRSGLVWDGQAGRLVACPWCGGKGQV